jgi:chromosome segregation ATPase
MQDLEIERTQRQRELQTKNDELESCQNQQSTTAHHREQLERAISTDNDNCQALRY